MSLKAINSIYSKNSKGSGSPLGVVLRLVFGALVRFFVFPRSGAESEMAKLIWLVRLRWAAIALFSVITVPAHVMGMLNSESVIAYVGLVGFLFVFNLITHSVFVSSAVLVKPIFICFQMALDLLVLTGLLLLSGGFDNPFVGLFILNAALGGVLIRGKYSLPFIFLCHVLLLAIQVVYLSQHHFEADSDMSVVLVVAHILLFLVWMVMRSLGVYLESHFEVVAQGRVLNEKQDRLRSVGALAAGFSHEFASPLNAAKIRLDRLERFLREQNVSKEIMENLFEAKLSIQSCEGVIHQMNSSQMDVRDFQLKSLRIGEFLRDVVQAWQEENPSGRIELCIEHDDLVKVPPINFAQVILNLLDNAFESNPEGLIRVRFTRSENVYMFVVEDDGPGFSQSILERRGEPFVTTKAQGTGLGLYVSEIFAQSLGGKLSIENRIPQGAKVTIRLPLTVEGA